MSYILHAELSKNPIAVKCLMQGTPRIQIQGNISEKPQLFPQKKAKQHFSPSLGLLTPWRWISDSRDP